MFMLMFMFMFVLKVPVGQRLPVVNVEALLLPSIMQPTPFAFTPALPLPLPLCIVVCEVLCAECGLVLLIVIQFGGLPFAKLNAAASDGGGGGVTRGRFEDEDEDEDDEEENDEGCDDTPAAFLCALAHTLCDWLLCSSFSLPMLLLLLLSF